MIYKVSNNFVKYIDHFATNEEVAKLVRDDLLLRDDYDGSVISISKTDEQEYLWDPGGPIYTNDEIKAIKIGEVSLASRHQHLKWLLDEIEKANGNKRQTSNGAFFKIHTANMSCFCVSEKEMAVLLEQVRSPALLFEAETYLENRNEKMAKAGLFVAGPSNKEIIFN